MAVRFKLSKDVEAIRSRMRRLPKLVHDAMDSQVKKDAVNVIKEYQHGIRNNSFGLARLSGATVQQKKSEGMSKPSTPLYGEGDARPNSLINALSIRKIKNGYRLFRRKAKHHASELPLNVLLSIHENGAIIKVTPRMRSFLHYIGIHLKQDTKLIRIPPRPVVDKAIARVLRKKKRGEPAASVRKAINELIKTGRDSMFRKLTQEGGVET